MKDLLLTVQHLRGHLLAHISARRAATYILCLYLDLNPSYTT